jgi:hypothetical protein
MIRYILKANNFAEAANVGGLAIETLKTIDGDAKAVEAWLREEIRWEVRSFVGIELIPEEDR